MLKRAPIKPMSIRTWSSATLNPKPRAVTSLATVGDRLHVTLVAGYVAIAGIYWFPGVPHTLLSQAKFTVFGALSLIGLLRMPKLTRVQGGFIVGLGLCAAAAFIANSLSTDIDAGIDQARDFIEPMLFLIALFGVKPRAYSWLFGCLTVTMTIFFVISVYPVGVYFGLLPNLYPPEAFLDPDGTRPALNAILIMEEGTALRGGFAGQSTTWGMVVPSAALLTAALYLRGRMPPAIARTMATTVVLGSVASIAVASARGGTFSLLAVSGYWVAVTRGIKVSNFAIVGAIIFLALSTDVASILPENFFRGFELYGGDVFSNLDSMSTGRLSNQLGSLGHFAASPIIGVGVEAALVDGSSIHNTWLKILAESGLLVFMPAIILAARLARLALARSVRAGSLVAPSFATAWPNARFVILAGMILSIAEPGTVFGTFNASATFWTAVWIELTRPRGERST